MRFLLSILIFIFFTQGIIIAQKPSVKQLNNPANAYPLKLASSSDTMQYTIGAFVAQWINNNGFIINNNTLFLKGMDDVFQNKPLAIPDSTVITRMATYQRNTQRERALAQEQQLFAAIRNRPGVGMLPNGVRYVILKSGKGPHPGEQDTLVINILAKLADGVTVVEDTYKTGKPFITTLAGLFPGLNEPLQMMAEGSKWQLFIPSVLAYGDKGTTLIPPNSALVIEAELVAVKPVKK